MLTFDEKTHTYCWSGKKKFSVTQILNEFVKVQRFGDYFYLNRITGTVIASDVFEAAQDFGTGLHKAVQLEIAGTLDWEAMHKSFKYAMDRFLIWKAKNKPIYVAVEQKYFSKRHDFAGTPDIICMINGIVYIIDVKSGEFGMAGPQLAAYEVLYREATNYKGVIRKYVLKLPKKEGDYKFIPMTNKLDWAFFQAKNLEHRYLRGLK